MRGVLAESWRYFCEGSAIVAEGLLTVLTWIVWVLFVTALAAAAIAGVVSLVAAVLERAA